MTANVLYDKIRAGQASPGRRRKRLEARVEDGPRNFEWRSGPCHDPSDPGVPGAVRTCHERES